LKKTGKKVIHFYNQNNSLDNVVKFLESIQKKINYLNFNVNVEGNNIKIILYGSRDLQYLAIQKIKELAHEFL